MNETAETKEAVVESGRVNKQTRERRKFYGENFPSVGSDETGKQWRVWIGKVLGEQDSTIRDKRLHWARHRHFRQGRQWITSRDGRTWRELESDNNTVRAVLDMIGPALDFRLSIIQEQRPGFRAHPLGTGIAGRETAEAQQLVAEHYYNRLNGLKLLRDAESHAQPDGVAFLRVYVDKTAGPIVEDVKRIGPDDERYEMLKAQGYEVTTEGQLLLPLSEEGEIADAGSEPHTYPAGDIATDIVLAHEVFFDAEARTVNGPYKPARWSIIQRVRSLDSAKQETGNAELKSETVVATDPVLDVSDYSVGQRHGGWQRGLPPFPSSRQRLNDGVYEYLVYIAPNRAAGLSKGMWRRVIGDELVGQGDELPGGRIPLARITDGSSDTEMYPRPVMSAWIPDQLTINAILSKLIEHVRVWGVGRTLAREGTILTETFTNVTGAVLNFRGEKPEFATAPHLSSDVWQTLQFFVKKLEDKTGWNDFARGQVTGQGSFADVSGRAILSAREQYERVFAPMIRAAAEGMTEWSTLVVDYARWLYEVPRLIPITGRGDLAKMIEGKDLGERTLVYVDPETLSPLPRALRNQMLFDLLEKQLITVDEYRKRAPFAEIRSVHMGDVEQQDNAQAVNTLLEQNWEQLLPLQPEARFSPEAGGVPVWWQDNPDVHKQALLELVLDFRKPLPLRDLAAERWTVYDDLARAQLGQAPPPMLIRGVPPSLIPPPMPEQPPEMTAGAPGQPAGASPSPSMSPTVLPEASQQATPQLGDLGQAEAAVLERQQS